MATPLLGPWPLPALAGSPVPAVPGHTYTRMGKHNPIASPESQEELHQLPQGLGRRRCRRCCYFLSVFLDIDTSSLHPQDGFQASILFPMATNTEPGNLNPLARLWQAREEVGEPRPPWAGHFSSTHNYWKAKLVTLIKQTLPHWGPWLRSPWEHHCTLASRATLRQGRVQKSPLHQHPSPARAQSISIQDGARGRYCSSACSSCSGSRYTRDATRCTCFYNTGLFLRERTEQRAGVREERGGRRREQANHISSNQAVAMTALKLFVPG